MKLYVMMDRVSGAFGNVFEEANDASVKRNFKSMIDSGSVPSHFAKDTVVFCVGEIVKDSTEPKLIPCISYVVCRGDEYEYSYACEENLSTSACSDC